MTRPTALFTALALALPLAAMPAFAAPQDRDATTLVTVTKTDRGTIDPDRAAAILAALAAE
jgi:hypothetical protein